MITKVGMQNNFGDALKDLLALEYDAVSAYEAAIERLKDTNYRKRMTEFCDDHRTHIRKISTLLESHNLKFNPGTDLKEYLTKGKVVIAALIDGDSAVLNAMLSNEQETNTAYERMCNHENIWVEARGFLDDAFEDEKKHKVWLESI